jgi:WD40 repeat protein
VDLLSQSLRMPDPSGPDGNGEPTAWWEADALGEYIDDNVVRHMMEAGRRQEAQALACDLRWVVHRLQASGTTSVLADLNRVATDRAVQLSGVVERVAHMLGETTTSPDASQFLLNALRKEPDWAQQAAAVQDELNQPMLVSHWPLPDNAGPALRHVYKIPSSTERSDAAALSPDGKWLAMAGDSGLFKVDATTATVLAAYRSDLDIDRIAIARDGSLIATLASSEGKITVRDAATGAVLTQGQDNEILHSVAFAPDGLSFVTTGYDGRVKLWDARTGTRLLQDDFDAFPLYSFDEDGHSRRGSVDAVFSDDGTCVASGGQNERIFLWKMPKGSPSGAFSADGSSFGLIRHVAVSPGSGHSWVAGSTGQKIHIWDIGTGDLITTLEAQGTVRALAVAQDGSLLASGDSDGTLLVWESGRFTLKARLARHAGVSFLGFSPDGQLLYSGGGGEARAWELRKAVDISPSDESTPVERVLVPPKGAWVAVAVKGGNVHIRDAASGEIQTTLTVHHSGVRNIAVAPDGTWLATECDGTIFIWDTTGWTLTKQFDVYHITGSIQDIFVSSDSRRLFTVDYIAVRAWDPWLGRPLTSMANCLEEAEGLSFAHDGSWLAAGDYYGTIWVWDADSGDLHSTLGGGWHYAALKALAATPENTLLAYPCERGSTIATWDVQRAEIVSTSSYPGGFAEQVAISPDGMIESGGHRTLEIGGPIAFSGDGQWLAVARDGATEVRKRSGDRAQTTVGRKPGDDLHRWPSQPQAIALNFHGDRLASADGNRLVIGETSTSEVVGEYTLRNGYPRTLAFSSDSRRLGIASGDRITVLDVTSGAEWELTGNLGAVTAAAGSSQGRHVAIAGSEGVRLWDARSGRAMALLDWHEHVTGLLFDRHEQWVAVAGYRGIGIFSLPQASRLKRFDIAHTDHEHICEMAATPDGTRVLVRNTAGNLIVIDLESGSMSGLVDLGWNAVDMMEISPNGEWLATGGQNLSVHRLPDGSLVATHSMNRRVKSISWSPDSNSVIVGGDGGVYFLLFKNQSGQETRAGNERAERPYLDRASPSLQ